MQKLARLRYCLSLRFEKAEVFPSFLLFAPKVFGCTSVLNKPPCRNFHKQSGGKCHLNKMSHAPPLSAACSCERGFSHLFSCFDHFLLHSQTQALAPIYWRCRHPRALKCFVSCSKVMTLITGTAWARSHDPHYCSPRRCAFPFHVCLRMFPGAQGEKKPAAVICISNKGSGCMCVYANTALLPRVSIGRNSF